MMSKDTQKRFPAEWEPTQGVLLAWPHAATDWNYMLPEVERCYEEMIRAVARHAVAVVIAPDTSDLRRRFSDIDPSRLVLVDLPTNDTWTRDYGPITTLDADGRPVINDFRFNAWGDKFEADSDNAATRRLFDCGVLRGTYNDCLDFVLEGGGIETDGCGTLLTTDSVMLTATRNGATRADVERRLSREFGISHFLWLDSGWLEGDDTDGHIDTLARLAPNDTILYTAAHAADETDAQSASLEAMYERLQSFRTPDGRPYNLVELPLPEPIYDEDGQRLPATYANYLVVNDAILLPIYGQPQKDLLAEMTMKIAFPDHRVERVDCRPLICQHGSLHCSTMQLPNDTLPL